MTKHDDITKNVGERVSRKHGLEAVLNEEYKKIVDGVEYNGERDVTLYLPKSNHYYEIKERHCNVRQLCARKQFLRHEKAHPGENWKYIYVTETRAMRYYPRADRFVRFR